MPQTLKPCAEPGCPDLTSDTRCAAHTSIRGQRMNQRSRSAAARGYDRQWRKVRTAYLRKVGWRCEDCGDRPIDTSRMHVHHLDRSPTGPRRFDHSNLEALCQGCHHQRHDTASQWMDLPTYAPTEQPLSAKRTVLGGYCRAGKSTLAAELGQRFGLQPRCTDELRGNGGGSFWEWGYNVAAWMDQPGPWLIEGVRVVNALIYRMDHGEAPNVDVVLWACRPKVELTDAQQRLNRKIGEARGMVEGWLADSGVQQYEAGPR